MELVVAPRGLGGQDDLAEGLPSPLPQTTDSTEGRAVGDAEALERGVVARALDGSAGARRSRTPKPAGACRVSRHVAREMDGPRLTLGHRGGHPKFRVLRALDHQRRPQPPGWSLGYDDRLLVHDILYRDGRRAQDLCARRQGRVERRGKGQHDGAADAVVAQERGIEPERARLEDELAGRRGDSRAEEGMGCAGLGWTRRGSHPRGVQPVPLALEGIRGKRAPSMRCSAMDGAPVDVAPAHVELLERFQHRPPLRLLAPERGNPRRARLGQCRSTRREEGGSRAHLEIAAYPHRVKRPNAVGEPDGLTHVIAPVAGVQSALDDTSGQVGNDGHPRRLPRDGPRRLGEGVEHRLHEGGVKCMRDGERSGTNAARLEVPREVDDVIGPPRHHGRLRSVDGGDGQAWLPGREQIADGLLRGHDGGHAAGRQRLHEAAPLRNEDERVLQGEHPSDAGRGELSHAVADQRVRHDAAGEPELGEGVLQSEERGLRVPRLVEERIRGGGGGHHLEERTVEPWIEERRAAIEGFAEDGMRAMESPTHPRVLGALAREDKGQGPRLAARRRAPRGRVAEQGAKLVQRGDGARDAHGELAATEVARVADVGKVGLGQGVAPLMKPLDVRVERGVGLGRKREEVRGPPLSGRRGLRRLLQDHERIGAADPKGVDPGAPRMGARSPVTEGIVHVEGAAREADGRVGAREVHGGRELRVVDRERRLDQACQPRRLFGMSDVALDRADRAVGRGLRTSLSHVGLEGAGQCLNLEGIAGGGAGGVALHVADGFGRHVGEGDGLHHGAGLAGDAGRGVADLAAAVVVDCTTLDDGVDVVAIRDGIGQALEENGRHPAAEDGALAPCVEGTAMPVERVHVALLGDVAGHLRDAHGGRAAQGHVALAGEQALAGEMHRHQRGRAGRLHGEARAGEVELVGDTRAEEVLVVAEMRQARRLARQIGMRGMGEEIARDHAASSPEDTDDARGGLRVVAGVVEGLPGDLEEETLLGIEQLRLARRVAEEGGVEAIDLRKHGRRPHVGRALEERGVHARRAQLRLREEANRLDAAAEIAPELSHGVRPREPAGHADDRDPRKGRAGGAHAPRPWRRASARRRLFASDSSSLRRDVGS